MPNTTHGDIVDILCSLWPDGPEGIAQRIIDEVINQPDGRFHLHADLYNGLLEVDPPHDEEPHMEFIYVGSFERAEDAMRYGDALRQEHPDVNFHIHPEVG